MNRAYSPIIFFSLVFVAVAFVFPSSATAAFNSSFGIGASGPKVKELQQILTDLGYYSGPIIDTFGPLTQAAVTQFQKANNISPVSGYVGDKTRAALNAVTNVPTSSRKSSVVWWNPFTWFSTDKQIDAQQQPQKGSASNTSPETQMVVVPDAVAISQPSVVSRILDHATQLATSVASTMKNVFTTPTDSTGGEVTQEPISSTGNQPFSRITDPVFVKNFAAENAYQQSLNTRLASLGNSYSKLQSARVAGAITVIGLPSVLITDATVGAAFVQSLEVAQDSANNYVLMIETAGIRYSKGDISGAKSALASAQSMRNSAIYNVANAEIYLSGATKAYTGVSGVAAKVSTTALKFGCAVGSLKVCSWAIVRPLDFAIDYATKGWDIAKRNLAADLIAEFVYSRLPIGDLHDQTYKMVVDEGVSAGAQSTGVQAVLKAISDNPQFRVELTSGLTKLGIVGAEDIVKGMIENLAQFALTPDSPQPPPPLVPPTSTLPVTPTLPLQPNLGPEPTNGPSIDTSSLPTPPTPTDWDLLLKQQSPSWNTQGYTWGSITDSKGVTQWYRKEGKNWVQKSSQTEAEAPSLDFIQCNGKSYSQCPTGKVSYCPSSGAIICHDPDAGFCNGQYWDTCPTGQTWSCSSSGGVCQTPSSSTTNMSPTSTYPVTQTPPLPPNLGPLPPNGLPAPISPVAPTPPLPPTSVHSTSSSQPLPVTPMLPVSTLPVVSTPSPEPQPTPPAFVPVPPTVTFASQPPSAQIKDYWTDLRNIERGKSVTLYSLVANTGSSARMFYAAVSLRRPNNTIVDLPLMPVPLSAGQSGNASWTYSFDTEGSWDVIFGVWQESGKVHSLGNTGWLNEYMRVNASPIPSPPRDISAKFEITTVSLGPTSAIVKTPYFSAPLIATGGTPPYEWSLYENSSPLPPGLSINKKKGIIEGTPTKTGTYNFFVQVKDSSGGFLGGFFGAGQKVTQIFTLVVK